MVKFEVKRQMIINTLRKIASLLDMIVAGVAIGALVESDPPMTIDGNFALSMSFSFCLSFFISVLADNLEFSK